MKKHIPNLITCMNVTSGTVALYAAFNGQLYIAAWLVILAMVFDFFDGFAARLLHVKSEMGKELDSLADVVSFGVVPSVLAFFLIHDLVHGEGGIATIQLWERVFMCVPLVIPAFSAYRLAKFNLDVRQTQSFIGLPTPSNALFWGDARVYSLSRGGILLGNVGKTVVVGAFSVGVGRVVNQ